MEPTELSSSLSPRIVPMSPRQAVSFSSLSAQITMSPRDRVCFVTPPPAVDVPVANLYDAADLGTPAPPAPTPLHRQLVVTPPRPRPTTPPKTSPSSFIHPASSFIHPSSTFSAYSQRVVPASEIDDKESICDLWRNKSRFNPNNVSAESARKRWARTGSRTKRRWRNDRLVDTIAQDHPPTKDDIKEILTHRTPTHFFNILSAPNGTVVLNRYLEGADMIHLVDDRKKPSQPKQTHNSDPIFRISAKIRPLFLSPRSVVLEFTARFESELILLLQACQANEQESETAFSLDPFQRLLGHGVCQYYHFKAQGLDAENGARSLTVSCHRGSILPGDARVPQLSRVLAERAGLPVPVTAPPLLTDSTSAAQDIPASVDMQCD